MQTEAVEKAPVPNGNKAKASADPKAVFVRASTARASLTSTRELVSKTKSLAEEVTQCVAGTTKPVSLAQEEVHEKDTPILDNFGTGAGNAGTILDSTGLGGVEGGGANGGFGHSFDHQAKGANGQRYAVNGHVTSHSSGHTSAHSRSWGHAKETELSNYHSVGPKGDCSYSIQLLQVVYIKAWLQITRLVAEYEWMITLTTCEDFVKETTVKHERAIQEKVEKLTVKITSYAAKLETYKLRYQSVYVTISKLTNHIAGLARQCQAMDATVSSLDKVRDAIHVIGLCPGLGRISFVTPSWDGVSFKEGTIDTMNMDDATIDAELHAMCKTLNSSFRAVETSELMLKTVSGLPSTNTMTVPLMGPCPNCEGDDDELDIVTGVPVGLEHATGHARVCWDPSDPLDTKSRRTDCGGNRIAVLCVDAHDSKWGNITSWSEISAYSYGETFSHSQGINFLHSSSR